MDRNFREKFPLESPYTRKGPRDTRKIRSIRFVGPAAATRRSPEIRSAAPLPHSAKESFVLDGVPEGAFWFAVRSYDDSGNRSRLSNAARVR